mgnify:CR=1 FL=1
MAFSTGKGAYFAFDDPTASLFDWSSYVTGVDADFTSETPETTTFGQPAVTRIAGLKGKGFSVNFNFDAALDRRAALMVGQVGTYRLGPNGSTGGSVRYTGEALCAALSLSDPHDGVITGSANFESDDTQTRDTF